MTALYEKTLSVMQNDSEFTENTILELNKYLTTDFSVNKLERFANTLSTYTVGEIMTLDGELKEGEKHMEFYLDENKAKELIISLFYKEAEAK